MKLEMPLVTSFERASVQALNYISNLELALEILIEILQGLSCRSENYSAKECHQNTNHC